MVHDRCLCHLDATFYLQALICCSAMSSMRRQLSEDKLWSSLEGSLGKAAQPALMSRMSSALRVTGASDFLALSFERL